MKYTTEQIDSAVRQAFEVWAHVEARDVDAGGGKDVDRFAKLVSAILHINYDDQT